MRATGRFHLNFCFDGGMEAAYGTNTTLLAFPSAPRAGTAQQIKASPGSVKAPPLP